MAQPSYRVNHKSNRHGLEMPSTAEGMGFDRKWLGRFTERICRLSEPGEYAARRFGLTPITIEKRLDTRLRSQSIAAISSKVYGGLEALAAHEIHS
jgi:hypothetical protein